MSGKQIATILKGQFLAKDVYMFTFDKALEGIYDGESKLFVDLCGNSYWSMTSSYALNPKSNEYVAYHMIDLEKAREIYCPNEKDEDLVIEKYAEILGKRAYIVGRREDGKLFSRLINIEKLQKKQKHKNEIIDAEVPIDELEQLILDTITEGKHSKEEIKHNREVLLLASEAIENVIGIIDTKLDAMNNNETFREHLDHEIEKNNKIDEAKNNGKDVHSREIGNVEEAKEKLAPTPTKMQKIEIINIDELFSNVTKTLIAQDEPAIRVITEIAKKEMDPRLKADGILLTGATGVGKTELMRLIAKYLDRPFYKINSTGLTVPGYTGTDIEEELWQLYEQCGGNKAKAERAIIYFDEIDKKGSKENDDVGGRGVLNVLLSFIEGAKYIAASDTKTSLNRVQIDTSNMIKILSGAFTDVYKNLIEKPMGFDKDPTPRYRQAEPSDFVKYGMMTDEFMGRVHVVKLNDLYKEELKSILINGNESALRVQEGIFQKLGVRIIFTDDYIDKVAEKANKKKTGARGLKAVVTETTWLPFLIASRYANDQQSSPHEILLTADTVDNCINFQLDGKVYEGGYQLTKKKKK